MVNIIFHPTARVRLPGNPVTPWNRRVYIGDVSYIYNRSQMRKRLMVVDDNPDLLYTVERILEEEDMEVITACNGDECLNRLGEDFHGLILMDIMMEEKNGWEIVEELEEHGMTEDAVIAMLTAKESPDEKRSDQQGYVVDYIRKPFTREELKARINECFKYID